MFFSGDREYPNNCPFSAHVLPGKWDVDLSINARRKKTVINSRVICSLHKRPAYGFLDKESSPNLATKIN